jgi:hypothetical protein
VKKNTALFKKKTTISVQPKKPPVPGITLKNSNVNATMRSIVALNLGRNLEMMRDVINSPIINKMNMVLVSATCPCFLTLGYQIQKDISRNPNYDTHNKSCRYRHRNVYYNIFHYPFRVFSMWSSLDKDRIAGGGHPIIPVALLEKVTPS